MVATPGGSTKKTGKKKSKDKSYSLRECSIQKRLETETKSKMPKKRGPKPRPKSAPMSKYRRKTANLRERQRMGEINVAFDKLREKLPSPISLKNGGKCEKLTKINILHVAINYIRAMENLLETGDSGIRSFKEMTKNPIRDDKNRKMEVQRVLEALMKRADRSGPTPKTTTRVKKPKTKDKKGKKSKKAKIEDNLSDEKGDEDEGESDEDYFSYPEWTDLSSTLNLAGPGPGQVPGMMDSGSDTSSFSSFNSSISSLDSYQGSFTSVGSRPEKEKAGLPPITTLNSPFPSTSFLQLQPVSTPESPQMFKEPDPLFSSLAIGPTTVAVATTATTTSTMTKQNKFHNNNNDLSLVNPQSTSNATSSGDDIMLKDFTDFVEMVDSLNGMPDIEFVQDNFEMFPRLLQ